VALLHGVAVRGGEGRLLAYFDELVGATGAGQALEFHLASLPLGRVRLAQVRRVAVLKTARYTFEMPLVCAAIVSGRASLAGPLRRACVPLGTGFQIYNDLHEVQALRGGGRSDDLDAGVRTEAFVRLHAALGEAERVSLQAALAGDDAARARLPGWLVRERIVEQLVAEAGRLVRRGRAAFAALPVAARTRRALVEIVDGLAGRLGHSEAGGVTPRAPRSPGGS
jgi:geranylgeranyl pyrophosphate synthase